MSRQFQIFGLDMGIQLCSLFIEKGNPFQMLLVPLLDCLNVSIQILLKLLKVCCGFVDVVCGWVHVCNEFIQIVHAFVHFSDFFLKRFLAVIVVFHFSFCNFHFGINSASPFICFWNLLIVSFLQRLERSEFYLNFFLFLFKISLQIFGFLSKLNFGGHILFCATFFYKSR